MVDFCELCCKLKLHFTDKGYHQLHIYFFLGESFVLPVTFMAFLCGEIIIFVSAVIFSGAIFLD